ncbi:hypothetical protein Tco_1578392 [Tanacetum coccineum]
MWGVVWHRSGGRRVSGHEMGNVSRKSERCRDEGSVWKKEGGKEKVEWDEGGRGESGEKRKYRWVAKGKGREGDRKKGEVAEGEYEQRVRKGEEEGSAGDVSEERKKVRRSSGESPGGMRAERGSGKRGKACERGRSGGRGKGKSSGRRGGGGRVGVREERGVAEGKVGGRGGGGVPKVGGRVVRKEGRDGRGSERSGEGVRRGEAGRVEEVRRESWKGVRGGEGKGRGKEKRVVVGGERREGGVGSGEVKGVGERECGEWEGVVEEEWGKTTGRRRIGEERRGKKREKEVGRRGWVAGRGSERKWQRRSESEGEARGGGVRGVSSSQLLGEGSGQLRGEWVGGVAAVARGGGEGEWRRGVGSAWVGRGGTEFLEWSKGGGSQGVRRKDKVEGVEKKEGKATASGKRDVSERRAIVVRGEREAERERWGSSEKDRGKGNEGGGVRGYGEKTGGNSEGEWRTAEGDTEDRIRGRAEFGGRSEKGCMVEVKRRELVGVVVKGDRDCGAVNRGREGTEGWVIGRTWSFRRGAGASRRLRRAEEASGKKKGNGRNARKSGGWQRGVGRRGMGAEREGTEGLGSGEESIEKKGRRVRVSVETGGVEEEGKVERVRARGGAGVRGRLRARVWVVEGGRESRGRGEKLVESVSRKIGQRGGKGRKAVGRRGEGKSRGDDIVDNNGSGWRVVGETGSVAWAAGVVGKGPVGGGVLGGLGARRSKGKKGEGEVEGARGIRVQRSGKQKEVELREGKEEPKRRRGWRKRGRRGRKSGERRVQRGAGRGEGWEKEERRLGGGRWEPKEGMGEEEIVRGEGGGGSRRKAEGGGKEEGRRQGRSEERGARGKLGGTKVEEKNRKESGVSEREVEVRKREGWWEEVGGSREGEERESEGGKKNRERVRGRGKVEEEGGAIDSGRGSEEGRKEGGERGWVGRRKGEGGGSRGYRIEGKGGGCGVEWKTGVAVRGNWGEEGGREEWYERTGHGKWKRQRGRSGRGRGVGRARGSRRERRGSKEGKKESRREGAGCWGTRKRREGSTRDVVGEARWRRWKEAGESTKSRDRGVGATVRSKKLGEGEEEGGGGGRSRKVEEGGGVEGSEKPECEWKVGGKRGRGVTWEERREMEEEEGRNRRAGWRRGVERTGCGWKSKGIGRRGSKGSGSPRVAQDGEGCGGRGAACEGRSGVRAYKSDVVEVVKQQDKEEGRRLTGWEEGARRWRGKVGVGGRGSRRDGRVWVRWEGVRDKKKWEVGGKEEGWGERLGVGGETEREESGRRRGEKGVGGEKERGGGSGWGRRVVKCRRGSEGREEGDKGELKWEREEGKGSQTRCGGYAGDAEGGEAKGSGESREREDGVGGGTEVESGAGGRRGRSKEE